MSRQLIKAMTMLLLVVALALFSAVASAYGQSRSASRADIPFEFVVGTETMAAGHYRLSSANAGGEFLNIRATDTNKSVLTLTIGLLNREPKDRGRLVFRRYGNRYFLAEIWQAGESNGRQIRKSKEEKAIQRELLSIRSKNDFADGDCERIEVALVKQ